MRIGFIKFGLKTYFNKDGTGQGANHELVDVFHIMQNHGHECFMISNSDIDTAWHPRQDLDWVFVFNGLTPNTLDTKMNMFAGSVMAIQWLQTHKEIPWAYFWTDPRYDLKKNPLFDSIPPKAILSQEPIYYAHLDKLILYEKDQPLPFKHDIFFSILMNNTGEKHRKKMVKDVINWLNQEKLNYEIKGDWKKDKDILGYPLEEKNVLPYLANVKYSFNVGKNPWWSSQKYWEMVISDVICFYWGYDEAGLVLEKDSWLRVRDGIDVIEKVKQLEEDPHFRTEVLMSQRKQLKAEYYTGEFIYQIIKEKCKLF